MKKPRCKYKKEINNIQIILIKNQIIIFTFKMKAFLVFLFQFIKTQFASFFI